MPDAAHQFTHEMRLSTVNALRAADGLPPLAGLDPTAQAIAEADAHAAKWLARLQSLPLYVFRVLVLLPIGATVYGAAAVYQTILNAARAGRDDHKPIADEPAIVTMPLDPRAR